MSLSVASCGKSTLYAGLVGLLILLVAQGCGPVVSSEAPSLPGDGTANLAKVRDTGGAAKAAEVDPWQDKELIEAPSAQAPKAVPLPSTERFTLKNGLEVIAVHDASLPVVAMQVAIKAGMRNDPREQVGLADLVAQGLARGTKQRSAARIASEIEAVGGTLQSSASYEAILLSCKSLAKDRLTCLNLVPDLLVNSNFPDSEMDIVRRNLLADVRQRLDDAAQLASAHFQSALWGEGHIRGSIMSAATIDAIAHKDLVEWHKRWVHPNNAILAISGDFDASKLKAELERGFAKWKPQTLPSASKQTLPVVQGLKIRLIDKPGQTQSHIRIGHLGLAHRSEDFYRALVFNHALGGGQFSSRLMKIVRSAEGKAYTASSTFDRNLEVGAFVAASFTRSAETLATVKLMQEVIAVMDSDGPTEKEVSSAITNIAGSYATRFETAGDVANALLAAEMHGLGADYVSNFPLAVAAVTRDQAAAAAARILDPVNAVLVIVGDASVVEPQLRTMGLRYEVIPHTAPVSDWERNAKTDALKNADDPERQAAARKLLKDALDAKGGKRLVKLKTFRWAGDATLNVPNGALAASVEKRFSAPDKLRLDMKIPSEKLQIATVLSSASGWAQEQGPGGSKAREFSAAERAALSAQLWREADLVLLRSADPGIVVRPLGERSVGSVSSQAIEVAKADGSLTVTLLIDPKSKLLLGMDYSDQGLNTKERFADYKKVQGVQVAYTRSTKSEQVDLDVKIKSFAIDEAIAPSLYVLPTEAAK